MCLVIELLWVGAQLWKKNFFSKFHKLLFRFKKSRPNPPAPLDPDFAKNGRPSMFSVEEGRFLQHASTRAVGDPNLVFFFPPGNEKPGLPEPLAVVETREKEARATEVTRRFRFRWSLRHGRDPLLTKAVTRRQKSGSRVLVDR